MMTRKTAQQLYAKTSIYAIAGVLLIVVATLLAGSYAWISRTSSAPPVGPLEQVTIAANTGYAGSCPVLGAQEKGYFANEGVFVAIQHHVTGKAALDAILQGKADLGTTADVPLMFAVMNGQPLSVVATIAIVEKDHGIVGRRDGGVVTPANLNGKRIGVTVGTAVHFFLDSFLNRQKLSTSEVRILDLKPEELSGALARGDIDAAAAWEPVLGALRAQLGDNSAMFYGDDIYDLAWSIAGTRDYVVSHPETIKKLLRALIRGAQFCKDTPEAAREIVAKAMSLDVAKVKELWPSYLFKVTLEQSLVMALEDQTRWAIRNKLTGGTDIPNYLNHVYLDALQAVTPAAVTVIH